MSEPGNSEGESARHPRVDRVFLSADERVRPILRALLFVIVGFILILGAQKGFTFLLVLKGVRGIVPDSLLVIYYLVVDVLLLLASWLFARALDRRSFGIVGLWFYAGWGRELLYGMGIGAGLMTLIVAVLFELHVVRFWGLTGSLRQVLPSLTATASFFLLAAAFEEIAFRGYAFQRLVDAVGPFAGVLLFSGLFGALHIGNPHATALSTANTVLAGILFSVAYLKTRGLWLPIGLHWAWNFFQGAIFSLGVSGLGFRGLLQASFGDPDWLSGGIYGPEGSVVATVVSLGAIICLARTRRVSPSPAMEEVLK